MPGGDEYDDFIVIVSGGRVRLPLIQNVDGGPYFILAGNNGALGGIEPFDDYSDDSPYHRFATVYGTINCVGIGTEQAETAYYEVLDHRAKAFEPAVAIIGSEVYGECGFVEGQVFFDTDVGSCSAVVKNGTLYPIITAYNQSFGDNMTINTIRLNGDNSVRDLLYMLSHSGQYLAYDEYTALDKWSPIENLLHQRLAMPIVPRIGYEPPSEVGVGNEIPGIYYEVELYES